MEGEQGVLAGLRSGCTWIDMSTTSEKEIKRLGAIAADKGAAVLEAPVTGGLALAKEGGITILVGGEKKIFEAQLPVLQVIGGKILHMGPLGSASVVKVITNLLALGHLILAGEAFMLGKKAGIDLTALFEGIKASSGNSYTIETELPLVYNGSYDVGFSLALACKDLGLAHELGRDHGVPLEIGGLIEQIFIRAKTQYGDDKNSTQAVKLLEDALNDYLRAAGY
jgi:3-hydroxyisobutyrate dehydrogenase